MDAPFHWQGEHVGATLPGGARALFTTRRGGVSAGPFASLNLGRLTADEAYLDRVADAFAGIVDAKSPWTYRHSDRTCVIAMSIAVLLGCEDDVLGEPRDGRGRVAEQRQSGDDEDRQRHGEQHEVAIADQGRPRAATAVRRLSRGP